MFIVREYIFILVIIALKLLTLTSRDFLLFLIYNLLLAIFMVYVLILYSRSHRISLIPALTITVFIPTIFDFWQKEEIVLLWDHKAQENIALFIAREGRLPSPLDGIYRIEYVSYPAGYTLWSILSQMTDIPTNIVMVSPLLTAALYILFLWVIHDILKHNNTPLIFRVLMTSLLIANFISSYKLTYYFIYQNYGRILLLLTAYIMYRNISRNSEHKHILPLIVFIFVLTFAHSESSIAFTLILTGLCLSYLLLAIKSKNTQRLGGYKEIPLIFFIAIIAFLFYSLWFITSFSITLLNMVKNIVNSLLSEGEDVVLRGVTRYTPWDYTEVELALYIASKLCLGLIALVNTVVAAIAYVRSGQTYMYLGPLVIVGIAFNFLLFLTPYKSDIAFKFLTGLTITTSLSFMELGKSSLRNIECKYKGSVRLVLFTMLLMSVSILTLLGSFLPSNRGDFSFSEINKKAYEISLVLESCGIKKLIEGSSYTRIVILDSPTFPYNFVRDYLAPRISMEHFIVPLDQNVHHYSYRQINGLQYPRFILTQQRITSIDQLLNLLTESLIIGDVEAIINLTKTEYLHVVHHNNYISVGLRN